MKKSFKLSDAAFQMDGKMPLAQAIPLGLQHVLAMFVGNLTPLLIITGACGIAGGEFAGLQLSLLQNAMLVAGIVTLVQLFAIGPVGGRVPIIMGTSSGFIGVFNSVAATMGGGVSAYGAIMGASILGGFFETVLGFFLKPLRKFFPSVVTGTVVMSIGLSLFWRWKQSGRFWLDGESAAGTFCVDCDIDLQALHKRIFEFFLDFIGYYCWIYCCNRYGICASYDRGDCRWRRVYKSVGAELGQGSRCCMVCYPEDHAGQAGI